MPGFRTLFAEVSKRPGMWFGRDPSYLEVCAFLTGCDAATDFTLLRGFREWLLVRTDGPGNLHWSGLIRAANQPGQNAATSEVAEEDSVLTAALWDAVLHFLDERDEHGGDARIFEAYIRWRDSKPYHDQNPIGSLNEREGVIYERPHAHASDDAHHVHRIRRTPVSALSAAECTKMVSLWLDIERLVPRSIQLIAAAGPDLSDSEHLDLLRALVALGPQWWAGRPTLFGDFQRTLRSARLADEAIAASWATLVSAVADDRDGGGD
jgi:hypothetical protein